MALLGSPATRFSDRPDGDISVPICWLVKGLWSEPSRVEGTPNVPKNCGKWRFFKLFRAFVHWCKRCGETRHQSRLRDDSSSAIPPSSLTSAPSASGPMTPEMSRHPRSTDSL